MSTWFVFSLSPILHTLTHPAMDLTIRHVGKVNDSVPDEADHHRRVLVIDTLDIALFCLLTATVLLLVVLCLKIKTFRRRRSSSSMANMVDFINKEVSTQACQLEILTETKCVYVQMYDGMGSQTIRCIDACTQTNPPLRTNECPVNISRQNEDTKLSAVLSNRPAISPKKPTGIIHTLSNFYSRHTAENQYLHPFSVSQLIPSNYKGKFPWKHGSCELQDEPETEDPRARLCERSNIEQRRLFFRRRQNEDGVIEGFENPIFRGVTHLDEDGQPVSRV